MLFHPRVPPPPRMTEIPSPPSTGARRSSIESLMLGSYLMRFDGHHSVISIADDDLKVVRSAFQQLLQYRTAQIAQYTSPTRISTGASRLLLDCQMALPLHPVHEGAYDHAMQDVEQDVETAVPHHA